MSGTLTPAIRAEQIAQMLQAAGVGVIGQTIFAHKMPPTVRNGLVIFSPLDALEIDHELPGWRRGRVFQIVARAPTHQDAARLIQRAMDAVTFMRAHTIPAFSTVYPAVRILYCRPVHDPVIYPRSESDTIEASVSFEAAYIAS